MANINEPKTLCLENLCGGAVHEVFQHELDKVLTNIADVNTDWKAPRTVTLTIKFKPHAEDRASCGISFDATAKLAPVKTAKGTAFLGRLGGQIVAVAHDPKQATLFQLPERPTGVVELGAKVGEQARALAAGAGGDNA